MEPCPHPADRASALFSASDPVTGDAFTVARCGRCALAVTLPLPDPHALQRYYPASYYGDGSARFPLPVELAQRLLYRHRARVVERLAGGRAGRVLDVGCGRGALLEAFRRRGWQVQGSELSERSAAFSRSRGIPVHVGSFETAGWPEGSFDAITFWHVLEHWADPVVPIREAARLLRPGGALMVAVPNFGSAEARATTSGWFHLDVPRHLAHLAPADLERLLTGAGFAIRSWSFAAPEYDVFSLVQSVENAIGLRTNLLYGFLRSPDARLVTGSRLAAALALALAVPLGVLAIPATALAAAVRQGGTVTAFAIRSPG